MSESLVARCRFSWRHHPHAAVTASGAVRRSLGSLACRASPESGDQRGPSPQQQPTSSPSSFLPPDFADPVAVVAWGGRLQRRAALSAVAATTIALGGNLGGVTSALLSADGGQLAGRLGLDVLVPVLGHKRCVEAMFRFTFTYPQSWLADQTLAQRAALRAEAARGLPAMAGSDDWDGARAPRQRAVPPRRDPIEPVVAFGPPGSSGEENVSVIVAPIMAGFDLASLGQPADAAQRFLSTIAPPASGLTASLLAASQRRLGDGSSSSSSGGQQQQQQQTLYYTFEYTVERPGSFFRHNVSVIACRGDQLYTFNAQCPEKIWPQQQEQLRQAADSFHLLPL